MKLNSHAYYFTHMIKTHLLKYNQTLKKHWKFKNKVNEYISKGLGLKKTKQTKK